MVCFFPVAFSNVYLLPFVLFYSASFIKDYELNMGRPSYWFRHLSIWKRIASSKQSSIIRTCELPDTSYIFAAHPHGVLPLGICLNIGTIATGVDRLFPNQEFRGVAVSCCFIIPFYRDLCLAAGGTDCRSSTIHNLLQHGCSPVVLPGGADESLLTKPHHNRIRTNHKGFVRIAIETGTPIVPMYSFGENYWWKIRDDGKPIKWLNYISKKFLGIRIPPIAAILPNNVQITTVIGSPIMVKQNINPCDEEVNRVHTEYVKQIKEIYMEFKPEGESDLVIES